MPPSVLDQAFDLFFSGREAGRGLGIGLAKVRRIVEGHRGRLSIQSQPHAGTIVEIALDNLPKPQDAR